MVSLFLLYNCFELVIFFSVPTEYIGSKGNATEILPQMSGKRGRKMDELETWEKLGRKTRKLVSLFLQSRKDEAKAFVLLSLIPEKGIAFLRKYQRNAIR